MEDFGSLRLLLLVIVCYRAQRDVIDHADGWIPQLTVNATSTLRKSEQKSLAFEPGCLPLTQKSGLQCQLDTFEIWRPLLILPKVAKDLFKVIMQHVKRPANWCCPGAVGWPGLDLS